MDQNFLEFFGDVSCYVVVEVSVFVVVRKVDKNDGEVDIFVVVDDTNEELFVKGRVSVEGFEGF